MADADGATRIEDVEHLEAALREDHYDIAVGSRKGNSKEGQAKVCRCGIDDGIEKSASIVLYELLPHCSGDHLWNQGHTRHAGMAGRKGEEYTSADSSCLHVEVPPFCSIRCTSTDGHSILSCSLLQVKWDSR